MKFLTEQYPINTNIACKWQLLKLPAKTPILNSLAMNAKVWITKTTQLNKKLSKIHFFKKTKSIDKIILPMLRFLLLKNIFQKTFFQNASSRI